MLETEAAIQRAPRWGVEGRCRDSPIRTWPRAFQGIDDVKARGWRLLITSLAPANLHRHGIDQFGQWWGSEAELACMVGEPSRGNITNSRLRGLLIKFLISRRYFKPPPTIFSLPLSSPSFSLSHPFFVFHRLVPSFGFLCSSRESTRFSWYAKCSCQAKLDFC